jgi:hypothetical protein
VTNLKLFLGLFKMPIVSLCISFSCHTVLETV